MKNNAFFIGWQKEQDGSIKRWLKKIVFFLVLSIGFASIALPLLHKNYANSRFERIKITSVNGILRADYAPFIEIGDGHADLSILLVSPGKFGAEKKIAATGELNKIKNKKVNIKGKLIYNGSHTLLEINELKVLSDSIFESPSKSKQVKSGIKLVGEIADPKCLFGVMNPGEGKVHKDCAIRCISGGITPVFKTINDKGNDEYYLILNEDHSSINHQLISFVADQIEWCGRVDRTNEWNVFYPDLSTIRRIKSYRLPGVTSCTH